MINGLQFKISSEELVEHCQIRARYHTSRAEEKSKELPALKEAMDRIKNAGLAAPQELARMNKMSMNSSGFNPDDQIEQIQEDIKNHQNKALLFDFWSKHFFDEDYNLGESDLRRLEIIK